MNVRQVLCVVKHILGLGLRMRWKHEDGYRSIDVRDIKCERQGENHSSCIPHFFIAFDFYSFLRFFLFFFFSCFVSVSVSIHHSSCCPDFDLTIVTNR